MQNKYQARDLVKLSLEEIKQLPPKFVLCFDDGEVITTRRRTMVSHFFWDYHRTFPKTPLKKSHHIQHILDKNHYNSDTHLKLCENIEKDVYPLYEGIGHDLNAKLSKIAYDASIGMTNVLMPELAPYVAPLDILDAIQIHRHPKIQEAMKDASPDGRSVKKVYDVAHEVIMTDPDLDRNGLAHGYRANTLKREQVLQSVAFRGVPTTAGGQLYRYSINTGYFPGFTDPYDLVTDSSSAAKAQVATEAPIKESEYLARRLQFLVSPVRSIEHYDCGAPCMDWLVEPETFDDDGHQLTKGGIKAMAGKFIEDPKTPGRMIELTGEEKELNGRYVRMRSVLNCRNKDPHSVCKVCFGGLYRNYYNHANLGHLCCVTITEKITQNTLSTKHLVSTGEGARIILTPLSAKYFKVGKVKTNYMLSAFLKKMQPRISIPYDEAMNLVDIMKMDNINDLNVSHSSHISQVKVHFREKGVTLHEIVPINQSKRRAYMTIELLLYIKEYGFTIDEENNFLIDLAHWDYDKLIFAVPQMEVSYSEHGQEVGRMIESNMSQIDERQKPDSPLNTLLELSSLVNSKLDIPLSCLEVIVYASMVPSRNNPALARGFDRPVLGVARQIITSRSLSTAYAFQGHVDFMLNAKSFFPHYRPDNQMDVFFAPKKVVEEDKKRAERKRRELGY